jgi:hypothetical protein
MGGKDIHELINELKLIKMKSPFSCSHPFGGGEWNPVSTQR